jgi:ketosteroid isomerase-like protein
MIASQKSEEGSMRFLAGISLAVLISACTTVMSSNDADAYIRSAAPRFISAFNAGNADAVAGFYTDDAVLLAPNAPIAKGNTAIRDAYRAFFGSGHPTLNFAADRIVQSCDVAYEYGHYTMGMGSMNDQGNYVTVWRRQSNGDWKIVEDSINSSMPAMAH